MDCFIEYYYNFSNIKSKKNNDNDYLFSYNGTLYCFSIVKRNVNEIYELLNIIEANPQIDSIIQNINGNYITKIYNLNYVLLKKNKNIKINGYDYLIMNKYVTNGSRILDKSNWVELWSRKIDNIEYNIETKNFIIKNSINYYIGMAESGISYIRKVINKNPNYNNKVIAHIRLTDSNIFNPQNLVIDYESRDIAEYLKYIYFNQYDICISTVNKIFKSKIYDEFTLQLIYGRLFFPSFYFDILDSINNNYILEEKLSQIVKKTEEYENYINYIYNLICEQKKIPRITWN